MKIRRNENILINADSAIRKLGLPFRTISDDFYKADDTFRKLDDVFRRLRDALRRLRDGIPRPMERGKVTFERYYVFEMYNLLFFYKKQDLTG